VSRPADPGPAVVTVTLNPAVDRTVWIPGFRAGAVNRVVREDRSPGGKGVNVAAFLAGLGVPAVATGFLGDEGGEVFERFLGDLGVGCCFVTVPGKARTGIKVVDEGARATTDINFPGFPVTAGACEDLAARLGGICGEGAWVVLAGSLPPGAPDDTYRRLVEVGHERGARVAVDASGPALAEALPARPELVKPNRDELEELVGAALPSRTALLAAADELVGRGITDVVVSLGAEGALFARADEAVIAVPGPVPVVSTVGAGDAMVAGAVAAARTGLPLPVAAARATACSMDVLSRVGPRIDREEVDALVGSVSVERLR
jgi:1-phosphofructokinase family hexose kinase